MVQQSLYLQIYEDFKIKIEEGVYQAGEKLPTENAICKDFKVSRITAKKAMEKLRNDGYITRHPGKGTYVNDNRLSHSSSRRSFHNDQYFLEHEAKRDKNLIGLIMPDFSESYGMEIVTGVEEACRQLKYNLLLRRTMTSIKNEEDAIEDLHQAGCAGIILMPQHNDYFNEHTLRLILDDYPIVIIDREMGGIDTMSVTSNNRDSAYMATQHLLTLGHKNIAFVSYPVEGATTLQERMQGFKDAHYDHKLYWDNKYYLNQFHKNLDEPDVNIRLGLDLDVIKKFVRENPEVTAFFATEYNFGQLVSEALRELNYRIPEDFSVISYDGPSSISGNPFLCRILQPQEEMGRQAVSLLDRNLKGESYSKCVKLQAQMRQGKSTSMARKRNL